MYNQDASRAAKWHEVSVGVRVTWSVLHSALTLPSVPSLIVVIILDYEAIHSLLDKYETPRVSETRSISRVMKSFYNFLYGNAFEK